MLTIPKMFGEIRLSDYAAEFGAAVITVWVNPPRDTLRAYGAAMLAHSEAVKYLKTVSDTVASNPDSQVDVAEALSKAKATQGLLAGAVAVLWCGGELWAAEDVLRLMEETASTDPQLFPWLTLRTSEMIREHRSGVKKG